MKKQVLSAICLAVPFFAGAQNSEEPTILKDSKGIIQTIEFTESDKGMSDQDFMKQYLQISADDGFVKAKDKQRSQDYTDDHYDQFYKNVKVDGAGYNFHYKAGKMFYAHGHFVELGNLDVHPKLTDKMARDSFANYKKIPSSDVRDFTSELLIKEITSLDSTKYLVFKIYLRNNHPSNDEIGFVDAQTGNVLTTEPIFSHASLNSSNNELKTGSTSITGSTARTFALPPATGTFATRYSGSRTASTFDDGGTLRFRLFDNTRGAVIHTRNLEGNTDPVFGNVELRDANNTWTTAEHSPLENNMGLDVHWALQRIYDRLNTTHAVNSFNDPVSGTGAPINAYIRYGTTANDRDNAVWNGQDDFLAFGDGLTTFTPVASVDVVAHEYGHGITDFQIGWGNTGDQGSFNEGLSDVWGAIMQHRITGGNIWQIAEQIMVSNTCLRDLQNTNSAGVARAMADTYAGPQYNANSGNPGIDKYVRSGVLSHWAYILANGESGTNDVGTPYRVYGMGMDQLENLIVRAIFGNFLDNTTTYAQVRTGMVNAARALCGNQNGVLVQQVENAWKAVNVGTATQSSISGVDHLCPSSTYSVANLPQGSTVAWSSSNTGAVTINSSGLATRVGSFHGSVTLTATVSGGCGTLVLTKVISVGKPFTTNIAINAPNNCVGTSQLVVATMSGNPTSSTWSITSGNASNASLSDFGNGSASFYTNVPDCYGLTLNMSNSCGSASAGTSICIDNCSARYTVFPNPAKDQLLVQFDHYESSASMPDQISLFSEKTQEAVYTIKSDGIYSKVGSDGLFKIDVGSLPRGTYYLHVTYSKNGEQTTDRTRIVLQ
ncbi:M4 family metallopeptidase [Dyadobacter sp. CY343]|uniref:M4 family metallopeptidase n=1 Tax=Dyadobacter sp. CY343 TaxID=2907299 RepID=UPI001F46FC80|nr:M4 family metallopeptidase [Dyadobacter sp. CY343]MCE7063397.1 M4 family metallopeptidase [Dyadobacter sp. CY343]